MKFKLKKANQVGFLSSNIGHLREHTTVPLSPWAYSPVTGSGPVCCAPYLSAFLAPLLSPAPFCFPQVEWLRGWWQILFCHAFVPFPFGVPFYPLPGCSHKRFIFLHSLSSLADGLRIPTWPVLFLSCVSTLWSLGSAGFRLLFGPQGFLSLPTLSLHSSPCPLWDMYFYLPLICSILFVERE